MMDGDRTVLSPLLAELPVGPDPMAAPELRWGILGAGGIAGRFAGEVPARSSGRVVAVGSRDAGRAAAFADRHGIAAAYGSYAELVAAPDVDAVYVATPHSEHRHHALLAIAAGKAVLVEKAFTRNAAEAREVFDAARAAGVFVMEAMWTRFLPHMAAIRQIVASGAIGDVVTVLADHGQQLDTEPTGRLLAPELAGGALLDLGVYPVSLVHDLLGVPDSVVAVGALTDTGVDGEETVVLRYGDRTVASCSSTLWARTPTTATIGGTAGWIEVAGPFYGPTPVTVQVGDERTVIAAGHEGGFQYQAAEVARGVAAGHLESPLLPWQDTVAVMTTLDEARRQLGVHYPGE
ncbi:Gfo/Idh/MocA family oxidoreductase [Georgenia sp. MJ173]